MARPARIVVVGVPWPGKSALDLELLLAGESQREPFMQLHQTNVWPEPDWTALRVGDEVEVRDIGDGRIIGFHGQRVDVRISRFGNLQAGVLAPRAHVTRKVRA